MLASFPGLSRPPKGLGTRLIQWIHDLMRDEKEGRKKQARSNKQQGKATQHTQGRYEYRNVSSTCRRAHQCCVWRCSREPRLQTPSLRGQTPPDTRLEHPALHCHTHTHNTHTHNTQDWRQYTLHMASESALPVLHELLSLKPLIMARSMFLHHASG